MPDLRDGELAEVQGSGRLPYVLKNVGGVYSCSCPAWRNQSLSIERRTCKHLRQYRGEAAETARVGGAASPAVKPAAEPSKTPAVLLAETWDGEKDVAGWWLSEKLDGVRAVWTGKQFLSRQGNVFHAPKWFTADLPEFPLDGELWLARRAFQRTVSIVRRQDEPADWRQIRYVVFDAPAELAPFERRLQTCREHFAKCPALYVDVLDQLVCRGRDHLDRELDRIESMGGEGIMLRRPESLYEAGRSSSLLKVKRFLDAEARVVDHEPGKGRHSGRLGALICELPSGVRFSVGSGLTDAERERPPAIGSLITFRYQELTERGAPRFPTYVRLRTDVAAAG
ncbi:MAG: DNA ligase [Planctomycetaceae bacterium]|nr:DNA ligase [Planctomycetaceae bacterium]